MIRFYNLLPIYWEFIECMVLIWNTRGMCVLEKYLYLHIFLIPTVFVHHSMLSIVYNITYQMMMYL